MENLPKIIKDVFSEDIVYLIKKNIEYLREEGDLDLDDSEFFRYHCHNDPFFVELHHMINERVCEWIGLALKPSYVFTSLYNENGICPPHYDRPQCEFTLDYCVSQKEPWPIYVNNIDNVETAPRHDLMNNARPYLLQENDGLILSGTKHWHYRKRLQKENHCDLLFFHFVGEDFEEGLD